MRHSNFAIPQYVTANSKTASHNPTELLLDNQTNVWLSAIKLACLPLRPLEKELFARKIAAAARRYGISDAVDVASAYTVACQDRTPGVRTESDYHVAHDWLRKHGSSLEPEIRARLTTHLEEKAADLGIIQSLADQYEERERTGQYPLTPTMIEFGEEQLHKLATGSVYTTNQFAALTPEELAESLPTLWKNASLGMNVLQPYRLGRCATGLVESEANVLEAILDSHGERPVHSEYGCAIEIGNDVLAAL